MSMEETLRVACGPLVGIGGLLLGSRRTDNG